MPCAQSVHAAPSLVYEPGGQERYEDDPLGQNLVGGQGPHSVGVPGDGAYVPFGQSVQDDAPSMDEYDPGAQGVQDDA